MQNLERHIPSPDGKKMIPLFQLSGFINTVEGCRLYAQANTPEGMMIYQEAKRAYISNQKQQNAQAGEEGIMGDMTITDNGIVTLDSRDVAVMVEKSHPHLLRDIGTYIKHIDELTESNNGFSGAELKIEVSDYFVESTYQDSTGRTLPCYLITRKGCEMIANKLTGAKGVKFTAIYIERFHEMEEALAAPALPSGQIDDKTMRARAMLLNAQTRQASMWTRLGDMLPGSPTHRQICASYASEALAGTKVLPLPAVPKTYTATEIGAMFGLHRNKIGSIANQHGLKTPEYGIEVMDKSPHSAKEVPTFRYYEKAIERFRKIIQEQ